MLNTKVVPGLGVIAATMATMTLAACGSSTSPPAARAKPAATPATQGAPAHHLSAVATAARDLAAADDDPEELHQMQTKLAALKPFCREAPVKLANEIYNSEQDLKKNGIIESSTAVAFELRKDASGLGAANRPTNCGSLLAAYLVLAESSS